MRRILGPIIWARGIAMRLLPALVAAAALTRRTEAAPASARCRPQVAGLTFNATEFPTQFTLSACPRQSGFTCCGAQQDAALVAFGVNCALLNEDNPRGARCCAAWQQLRCVACDGLAAIGRGRGVCGSACDAVFEQCADAKVAWDEAGTPLLCRHGEDLVCAPMRELVADGADLCKRLSVPVDAATDSSGDASTGLAALAGASGAGEAGGDVPCFDGSSRPPPASVLAEVASAAADAGVSLEEVANARRASAATGAAARKAAQRRRRRSFSGADVPDDDADAEASSSLLFGGPWTGNALVAWLRALPLLAWKGLWAGDPVAVGTVTTLLALLVVWRSFRILVTPRSLVLPADYGMAASEPVPVLGGRSVDLVDDEVVRAARLRRLGATASSSAAAPEGAPVSDAITGNSSRGAAAAEAAVAAAASVSDGQPPAASADADSDLE